MVFYVIDPSLRNGGGHHFEYDIAIASAARATGQNAMILAHKDCSVANESGIEIIPWFSSHIYEDRKVALAYGLQNFLYFNRSFLGDLRMLQKRFALRAEDTILVPTLTQNQLFGLMRWASEFKTFEAPLFVVYLMFSPDYFMWNIDRGADVRVETERTLFYRLAFDCAAASGARIRFFAGGREMAREYSALTGSQIESHPLPLCLEPKIPETGAATNLKSLLYAGVAVREKGFLLLPEVTDRLSMAHPEHRFLIHVDFGGLALTQPDMCIAFEKLSNLNSRRPNVTLLSGNLTRDDYVDFIKQADCLVCMYNPAAYARKTSGVVWEAVSLGLPILAPAGTFPQREAAEWGAGHRCYSSWATADIAAAYSSFSDGIGELIENSRKGSETFRGRNGDLALAKHLRQVEKAGPAATRASPMRRILQSKPYLISAWLKFRIWKRLGFVTST